MRLVKYFFFLLLLPLSAADIFVEKPYLQLGNSPALSSSESLVLMWHAAVDSDNWSVEVSSAEKEKWRKMEPPAKQRIAVPAAVPPIEPHWVYRARLTGLAPGAPFRYRVLKAETAVFQATAQARKSASQAQRFVLFGDCAEGKPEARTIAYQASLKHPDFLFIAGDIVYSNGRISEYREKFFPVYNPDAAAPAVGAPLLRSIPFIAAPGNHDTELKGFQNFPDALAYFFYWDQPLNGPPVTTHKLLRTDDARQAFLDAAGSRYPNMANFSFDYGNAHWTVLDSNRYMNWTDSALQDWIKRDLASARNATWRFVAFHHPGFNSSKEHLTDQWMRVLSPIFEQGGVDIVFSGHVHNYQRTYPLTFAPKPDASGTLVTPKGEAGGEWQLDKSFTDGKASGPHGIVYIISGGGGASLYNPEQQDDPSSWQPFTQKYIANQHSFTLVDIHGKHLQFQQVSEAGAIVDSFELSK